MKASKMLSWVLTVGMCASLAACGSKQGETVAATENAGQEVATEASQASETTQNQGNADASAMRIAWWGSQERHNATIKALDEYAEQKNTKFSYEYTSWTSYFENLATQAVGNNLPDIIQMSTTDIINYAKNKQIIDLQPYVDEKIIDTTNMEAASLDGGKVEGQLSGITTGVNTVAVVYNKDIFEQAKVDAPSDEWTWTEFLNTAKTIYDATGIQTEIPFLSEARWAVEAMVRSYGYDLFSEDGKSLPWAEDEKVIAGVAKTIQDIYNGVQEGYLVNPEEQVAWSTTEDYYIVKDKAAMSLTLSNYYSNYSQALGKELGIVMLPVMEDGSQSGMYLNSNMYWCISSNCKNPEAAAEVINYLINDVDAAKTIGVDRGISLSSAVRDMLSSSADIDTYTKNTLDYVGRVSAKVDSTNPADPINSAELISVLKNDYIAVMYGEMTAEDCVGDFITQAQSILP